MGHSQRSNCFDCVKEPFSPYDMPIWRRLHLMFAKLITCFSRKRSFRLLYQPTVDDCWLACDDATRDGS
ncbi:hypothetical protein T06_866 [Trichinella sp. T6]|nr:hypothetical protein T06_866 [Trichinella sp. T6]